MSHFLSRRFPIAAIFACVLAAAQSGCRSQAHSDVYRQKMAREIRVLEDQLYEADYENRVLHDKLHRAQSQLQVLPPATSASQPEPESVPAPVPDRRDERPEREPESASDDEDEMDLDDDEFNLDDLSLPMLDEGTPIDPDSLTDPDVSGGEASEPPSEEELDMLPAPGGPEPPGRRDTIVPPVVPGEIAPPPSTPDDEPKPPGQIELPDSAQGSRVPESLRLHKGLSGGTRRGDTSEGMTIVITTVDKLGRTVDLESFDVDATLSVVILDPNLAASKARIGRWDFTNEEVAKLVQSDPISGLHVPVTWQGMKPSGDEVIVHVRLRAEDDEMRCEGRLNVQKKVAVTEWTPRG